MNYGNWFRGRDLAICIAFPALVIVFVLSAATIHGPWVQVGEAGIIVSFASIVALPAAVVIRVARDNEQTRAPVLWIESCLAGLWLGFGAYSFLNRWSDLSAVLIGGACGLGLALTPFWIRSTRARLP